MNELWADNGDMLSRIYAGTGALKSAFTRSGKTSMFGILDDAAKSVNRFYVSNFQDKGRQEGIDLLLGKTFNEKPLLSNNLHHSVINDLNTRVDQFSSVETKIIFIGTYNLNGKLPGRESLDSWLMSRCVAQSDLIIIGVQELIELNAGAYISADTDKIRLVWESAIFRGLNKNASTPYVILRSIHLVALGIFAFASSSEVPSIRSLETCSGNTHIMKVKTGLMGMAANKGGIGISLMYNDTSIAFVTAHFAAGNDAVEERNRDYWTLTNSMSFKGRTLVNHE